ncbi:hypothetical protein ACQJBY_001197 [Aegilops geniculata]
MKTTAYGVCYGQQEQVEHSTISRSQRAICARLDRQCADGPPVNNDDGDVVHTTTMETSAGTTTFPSVRTPVIVTHSMSMMSMSADNLVPDTGNNGPLRDASPRAAECETTHDIDLLVAGTFPAQITSPAANGNPNILATAPADAPPSEAGPSNWQPMRVLPDAPSEKREPDVVVARFARLIIDQPSTSDIYSLYGKMGGCSPVELRRTWFSHKYPW